MSDMGRQSLTDKATSAVKPDSEKSYVEQATDMAKGALDSVASVLQPQQEKTTTQKVGDALTGDNRNKDVA
ncbi:hypothetical protein IAU60_001386 [Kwoniella sp. DSM 27419]